MENKKPSLTRWTKNGTLKSDAPRTKGDHAPALPISDHPLEHIEEIQKEMHAYDQRLVMHKKEQHLVTPRLNSMYDSLGTSHAWRYCADSYAIGNFSIATGGGVTSEVVLNYNKPWDLKRWPTSPQLYLVLTFFSCCPRVLPATPGNITVTYVGNDGYQLQLGVFNTGGAFSCTTPMIIPSPITDIGRADVGKLTMFMGTGSNITCDWQAQFSTLYLLPSQQGNDVQLLKHNEHLYG